MVICAKTTAASVVKTLQHRKFRPQCIRDSQIQIFIIYFSMNVEYRISYRISIYAQYIVDRSHYMYRKTSEAH